MSALPHADPGWGVFETMLVLAGRAVELDAHLERLGASVAALYGKPLPPETRASVIDGARRLELAKLRITVTPAENRLELSVSTGEIDATSVFPAAAGGAALRSSVVPGGLGEHKWVDRRLLERATAAALPGELPLLLDDDGTVLEASRASVFAVVDACLVTPPTDGRILPSIARQQAIEVAIEAGIETREARLTLVDLRAAPVFLTGSVRGVEPVRAIDGTELPPPGEVSERVADALRGRWAMAPGEEPVAAAAGGRRGGRPGR